MAELHRGKLRHTKKGGLVVDVAWQQVPFPLRRDQLAASLQALSPEKLDGLEVEFEREKGQPVRIRRPGEAWIAPASSIAGAVLSPPGSPGRKDTQRGRAGRDLGGHVGQRAERDPAPGALRREYHNPYNFIPAPPRDAVPRVPGGLGDSRPPGHYRYHPDLWTGTITVRMRTVTPLLILDAARAEEGPPGHKRLPVRMVGGQVYIPPTSIKGMLRAAYEAVTNSRFGVFRKSEHDAPLAYRAPAESGLRLVPARIEDDGTGGLQVRLLPGTSQIQIGTHGGQPLYAAWLPRYHAGRAGVSSHGVRYPDDTLPQHGEEVRAWLEEVQHYRWDKRNRRHTPDFRFWRVVAIARADQTLSVPSPLPPQPKRNGQSYYQSLGRRIKVSGYVCITNQNINRKHDERVFFMGPGHPQLSLLVHPLTNELREQWRNLINNYRNTHNHEDIWARKGGQAKPWDYIGGKPGETAWSRHLYAQQAEELKAGDLCYVEVRYHQSQIQLLALYPVIISRRLFAISPWDLVPDSLRPAASLDELSPADRVFGWVSQEGRQDGHAVAWRGCLRVGRVTCLSEDPVLAFPGDGLPLAILGQPKPQQCRFYGAKDQWGTPLPDGWEKANAYQEGPGLRGRKVYPHHAVPDPQAHWDNPMQYRPEPLAGGWYQEYRRPPKDGREQPDAQNRSIRGWIKPGVEFRFDVYVENLSEVELGALLWLLSLGDRCYHRLGGGKPLGFGSVHLSIESSELRCGREMRAYYRSLDPDPVLAPDQEPRLRSRLIDAFQRAVVDAYGSGSPFEKVRFIAAFMQAATGFEDGKPVHYPRTSGQRAPDPDGEGYRWFVSNEKNGKLALPPLWQDTGLPYLPDSG